MKQITFLVLFLAMASSSFAQKGLGLDGTLGFGINGSEIVNPVLLEGRVQWNDLLSSKLGIGLWNSGYKNTWREGDESAFTIFHISDSKALPSVQLSSRAEVPVFKFSGKQVHLFAEPKLIFLPFSARTTVLEENYYTISAISGVSGETYYDLTGSAENNLKCQSHPRLYYGVQGGLSMEAYKNFEIGLGFGYTNMDLFKDLRGLSLHGVNLDSYIPKSGMFLLSISLLYHYNLY